MSAPSKWPLSDDSIRFIAPAFLTKSLGEHPLTRECYPTAMGFYPCARGHRMRRSAPDDYLLLYCAEGEGSVSAGGERVRIQAGDAVLLNKGVSHEYAASPKAPWSLYWVHFQGSAADSLVQYAGFSPDQLRIAVGASPPILALLNNLLGARHTGYSEPAFILAANQLRLLFARIALLAQQTPEADPESLNLSTVQAYMRENLHQALDLDTVASIAGLSKFHFSNRYRALTGYPPMRHFTHMKMEEACRLLDTTEQPVKFIAESLAFDDPLYFSRVFRKIIGCSPRQYRASNLG